MVILRDEKRIKRLRLASQVVSLVGMGALLVGLFLAFSNPENFFLYEIAALMVGWLFTQIGMFLAHRYVRDPRPDEVLDEAVKKVARNGRMYHYLLPAPHVLLTPNGIILFVLKFQSGDISHTGKKWKQSGLGLRRFFGQEALGNPSKEAEDSVSAMANYLNRNVPEIEEVPMAVIIVFTSKGVDLDVKKSDIPALHFTKLKGYLRQGKHKGEETGLSKAEYEMIRAAFDQEAGKLAEATAA